MNELVKFITDAKAPELPADRAATWSLIGRGKLVMDQGLQQRSHTLRTLLLDYEKMEALALTQALDKYKATHTEMVAFRRSYTTFLDQAVDQCMTSEKEYDPRTNDIFRKATARNLELREEAQRKVNASNAKATEIATFNAHYKNEWYRLAAAYRTTLDTIIHNAYTTCLQQKIPADNVHIAITAATSAMNTTRPPELVKIQRVLIPDAEATTLFGSIAAPNWPAIYKEYVEKLNTTFSMYANDLAAADAVVEQLSIQFNAEQAQAQQQVNTQAAATVLTETASIVIATPEGLKPITETSRIKIETKSEVWVVAIQSAFLANFQKCFPMLGNKDYSLINIKQQAAALDAAGVKVSGIEYETIKK